MSNTYTQLYIHCIFAVKYRSSLITNEWKERLYKYITGIIQNHKHKMIAINSMPDHVHLFFGMRPDQSLSDLIRIVKGDSSEWINAQKLSPSLFRWQEGYGAFSYAKSDISKVAAYIENQETHHQKRTFIDEYKEFLTRFGVNFDDRYIFKDPE
ncbi:MAG: IS200/IS605 family transposase [Chitinophagaceae bacterium]|nr:IS200/IS605 family transposase [Chitinophagaceae bacterium]